jgi:hypothetical protein
MPLPGNPLGYARDIAEGNAPFTALQLKRYTPEELTTVRINLGLVMRDVRLEKVKERDLDAIRRRAQRIQRINEAILLVEAHAKRLRISLKI